MLSLAKKHAGFTLVELMVGVFILGILFSVAAPSFTTMAQNSKIRTTAEAVLNGLQLARAEGVSRNAPVRFQLTDSLTSSCALSTTASNWVISLNDPTAKCDNAPDAPPASPAAANPANPYIIQSRPSAEGSTNVILAAPQPTYIFNGLGRLSPAPLANLTISISNPTGGLCAVDGGPMRCMSIIVTAGGQIRMCNPALPATNTQGC